MICVSKMAPQMLVDYFERFAFFFTLRHHNFINKAFVEKLDDIKLVVLDMQIMIVQRSPDKLKVLDCIKAAISTSKHSKRILHKTREFLEVTHKSKVQDLSKEDYQHIMNLLKDHIDEANRANYSKYLQSELNANTDQSNSPSSVQTRFQRLPPIQDPTPEKMVNILEKLICEYSKGYPPTSLYHIDVLAIDQMHKLLGSFIVQPDAYQTVYLPTQLSLTTSGQLVFKSFSNLRAFMAFSFLLDNRVHPNSHTFGVKFSEMTPFSEALAAVVIGARPNTIVSSSMAWLISKLSPEIQEKTNCLVKTFCSDAIEKYLSLSLVDDSKLLESRCRVIDSLLKVVIEANTGPCNIKIEALTERNLRQKKEWPKLEKKLSHEHLDFQGLSPKQSRRPAESFLDPNDDRSFPDPSISDRPDMKLIKDIEHFNTKGISNSKDNDLRTLIIKMYTPYPDFSVVPNMRELSLRILKIMQENPIPMTILSSRQLSANNRKEKKHRLTTQVIAGKFMNLIHKTAPPRTSSQKSLIPKMYRRSTGSLGPKSLENMDVIEQINTKSEISKSKDATPKILRHQISKEVNSSFEFNNGIVKEILLPGIPNKATRDKPKILERRSSVMGKPRERLGSYEKPKLQVLPPVKIEGGEKKEKNSSDKKVKGFFLKMKIDKTVQVKFSRKEVESSYARELLFCRMRPQWTEADELLMNMVHRAIREENELIESWHWNRILQKERKSNPTADHLLKTILDESIVRRLFQVTHCD